MFPYLRHPHVSYLAVDNPQQGFLNLGWIPTVNGFKKSFRGVNVVYVDRQNKWELHFAYSGNRHEATVIWEFQDHLGLYSARISNPDPEVNLRILYGVWKATGKIFRNVEEVPYFLWSDQVFHDFTIPSPDYIGECIQCGFVPLKDEEGAITAWA